MNTRWLTQQQWCELLEWLARHPHYRKHTTLRILQPYADTLYIDEADYYDKPVFSVEFHNTGVYTQFLLECESLSPSENYSITRTTT